MTEGARVRTAMERFRDLYARAVEAVCFLEERVETLQAENRQLRTDVEAMNAALAELDVRESTAAESEPTAGADSNDSQQIGRKRKSTS